MDTLLSFFEFTPGNILHLILYAFLAALWIAGRVRDHRHRQQMEMILKKREAIIAERNAHIAELQSVLSERSR